MQTKAKRRSVWNDQAKAEAIKEAIGHLKDARWLLRGAGSKNAADYVARALKSAHGARNHAERVARYGL